MKSAAQRRDPSTFPEVICGYGHYQHLPLSCSWCSQCGAPLYWRPTEPPKESEDELNLRY